MKKIVLAASIALMSLTSLNAFSLTKINNEIVSCSQMPQEEWKRDKWMINLNDNVIVDCNHYVYSAKYKSWFIVDNDLSKNIKNFNEISKIYKKL